MLATILRTPVADIISMQIIDTFVYMRKYLSSSNKDSMLVNHENRILKLEESFDRCLLNKHLLFMMLIVS